MASTRRAETIALPSLSRAINKAVALAAKRHDVVFERENIIYNWEILGRILRETGDLDRQAGLEIAEAVMRNLPGVRGQPVVTKIGKDILVGFIERIGRTIRF